MKDNPDQEKTWNKLYDKLCELKVISNQKEGEKSGIGSDLGCLEPGSYMITDSLPTRHNLVYMLNSGPMFSIYRKKGDDNIEIELEYTLSHIADNKSHYDMSDIDKISLLFIAKKIRKEWKGCFDVDIEDEPATTDNMGHLFNVRRNDVKFTSVNGTANAIKKAAKPLFEVYHAVEKFNFNEARSQAIKAIKNYVKNPNRF